MNDDGSALVAWFISTLRNYPEIAIFLTLGIGFWFGKLKFGKFSLGVVTSTLLAGVLVGQLGITISPHVKSTFFLMFLFAVGYGVGPEFFRGLKSDGLQQVLFAIVLCVACLLSAVLAGKILHYDAGASLKLHRGDVLTLAGAHKDVERVAIQVGYPDRPTDQTDMMFMGFGIVVGALIGALTLRLGGVPLSLSTAGGALIAGLVCGWLRSVHRTFGRIPAPALWVFNEGSRGASTALHRILTPNEC